MINPISLLKARVGEAFTVTGQKTRQLIRYGARDRTHETIQRNLLPSQVETILETALQGDLHAQAQLFGIMEDTWPRLSKNLNEVKRAVSRLPWEVQPYAEKGEDPSPEAVERAELVEKVLWNMRPSPAYGEKAFPGTVYDLLDAMAKGISVQEIYWGQREGGPFLVDGVQGIRAVKQVPAHYYAYPTSPDQDDRLMLSTTGQGQAQGNLVDFPPDQFLIGVCPSRSGHPSNTALLRSLAKYWVAAQYGFRWLARYAELFGQPIRWATYDPKNTELLTELEGMLENLGSAGWGAFPVGTTLDLKEPTRSGTDNPQNHLITLADRACDILILGQTLTTDVADSGSRALGDTHAAIRLDVLRGMADWAGGVLNDQLVPAILRMNYGDTGYAPTLDPCIEEPKDAKGMVERDKILFTDMGLPVAKSWLYERHGVPIPGENEELFSAPKMPEKAPGGPFPGEDPSGSANGDPGGSEAPSGGDDGEGGTPGEETEGPREQAAARDTVMAARKEQRMEERAYTVAENLTGVSREWLAPVKPVFRDLVMMAEDDTVTDEALVEAVEQAISLMPELFQELNTESLATALEKSMGAAAANGLVRSRTKRGKGGGNG